MKIREVTSSKLDLALICDLTPCGVDILRPRFTCEQ